MASSPTMTHPPPGSDPTRPPNAASAETEKAPSASGHALVPTEISPQITEPVREKRFQPGAPIARLPVELNVVVPVRNFRVRNLLALDPGQVVESYWSHGEDLPLTSGAVQLAWSEFEVVDTRLAVRVTRLA